ncbi:uncharacterized protein LDX57_009173 [Aspergillus melleus]|uniref:uncharacterized protein n=1 Tax=Aspergillus melleus TaxID=138277 RepID=UPI001E8E8CE7|nr:uncharacterized protein LDX57_009173 [Aspergillus melleus]KAH8431510.1 hypothetical protein LDX57_009173 [Aspergillus melleus]
MAPPSLSLLSLAFFSILAHADDAYFSVGDLGQYTTDGIPTPVLTGSVIDVTSVGDPANNGILVFLSPDMQTSLKSTMDSDCTGGIDSKCYQEVLDVLESPSQVLQSRSLHQRGLEPRNPLLLLSGAVAIISMIVAQFYEADNAIPEPIKIPPDQLEESFDLETATAIVFVTENDKPTQTITQPAEQDKATGLPATITTFASATNGASKGDLGIVLDSTVAAHLQALLSGSETSSCEVGDDFFSSSSLQTRSLDMTSIICGAENILVDGIGREGYPNWLVMNQGRFPWTNAELVAGRNAVVQWALTQAHRLNPTISATHLRSLAVGAFALAVTYSINGVITTNNVIPSASLQGGPTATVCQAQTATQCGAACEIQPFAPQFACSTACSTVTSCDALDTITTTRTATMTGSDAYPTGSTGGKGQQIAVASYINPLSDPAAWDRLIEYPVEKMPILVANAVNGPDSAVDENWQDVIQRASSSGKTVLGYVRTGYLGVSVQKFQTRLGSGALADWTAQIEEDVDMWYSLYGDSIGGIFFDEGWPECGDNNEYVDLYKYINAYTKRAHPGALTVLNPGSPMASCFEDTMDTLLTFELSYDAYMNSYTPNDWTPKDPRKLWHIVYDVPASAVNEVAKLAKKRGAGMIQLTDDTLPNPYDTLPADSYIQSMMNAIDGGKPLNAKAASWKSGSAAGAVSGLSVTTSDYSSAKITWNSASNALGYHVYSGDSIIASVPSSMTTITIGGLTSGSSHELHVKAVGGGGDTGSPSNTVTVNTKSLPGGKTVVNYHSSPGATSTTIQADILVPYSFVRLYLWDSVGCEFDTNPGWSVNFKVDNYVCTHYMVEGTTLYSYNGVLPEGSTAPPWSWKVVDTITLDVTGYTYKWTLPLGTSTVDTSKFVVQAQGYNPLTNAFEPDPIAYDCKGSPMCTTPDLLKWCDHAVNTLHRDDDPFYFAASANETGINQSGNCWGDQTRSCGVFIQGDDSCRISGNDLWNDYQNIRNIGGCSKCGSFEREDGCLVTINYVYGCDNHS